MLKVLQLKTGKNLEMCTVEQSIVHVVREMVWAFLNAKLVHVK